MNEKIDIFELVKRCPDATIHIRAEDLSLFGRKLLAEARIEFERQETAASARKAETYLDPETTKTKLHISGSTLYRLAKAHVLEPVRIGGLNRYRLSDIERVVSEGK